MSSAGSSKEKARGGFALEGLKKAAANYFKFRELGTNYKTEIIAGVTTFMTMAYIIFVNPAMISQAGIDFGSAMTATCLSAAVATILMGLYANYPIGLAPGMGENAFFTFTVCLTMGIPWQTALGCVFIQGVLFILLTLTRMRQALIDAIPASIRHAIACGIGLLIAFLGLKDAGIVVASPATVVQLGDIRSPSALLALFGLIVTGVLMAKKIKGGILWGILATSLAGAAVGLVKYQGLASLPPSIKPSFFKMDLLGAMDPRLGAVIFVFLFMGIFDTVGTLAGVGQLGGFMKGGKLPRAGRALMVDAVGTCVGAACGTPTVTCYIESASGIAAGGRSGFASCVTGTFFLLALFFAPLVRMIGGGVAAVGGSLYPVTAPTLIVVGSLMLQSIVQIDWQDYTEALPAFLVIILIPLSFNIASGVAFGFIAYAGIKLLTGRGREVSWLVYLMALLFVLRFACIPAK